MSLLDRIPDVPVAPIDLPRSYAPVVKGAKSIATIAAIELSDWRTTWESNDLITIYGFTGKDSGEQPIIAARGKWGGDWVDSEDVPIKGKAAREFDQTINSVCERNRSNAELYTDVISKHLGGEEFVRSKTGKDLQYMATGTSETYLEAPSEFLLLVAAVRVNANAIMNWQPNCRLDDSDEVVHRAIPIHVGGRHLPHYLFRGEEYVN